MEPQPDTQPKEDPKNPEWVFKYRVRRDAATPIYPSMINMARELFRLVVAEFGMKIYRALSSDEMSESRNMVFSPCLAQFPLLPLFSIAGGETHDEIKKTLGFEQFTDDVVHSQFQYAYYRLNQNGRRHDQWRPHGIKVWDLHPIYVLLLKQSVVPPSEKWVEERARAFRCYDSVLHGVRIVNDFDEKFTRKFNASINGETFSVFAGDPPLPEFGIEAGENLAMTSAIYFGGIFVNAYRADQTKILPFNVSPIDAEYVKFICNETLKEFAESAECQVLGMEFCWGSLTMYIFLPKQHLSLKQFQDEITAEKMTALLKEAATHRVHKKYLVKYAVPEFRIRGSHDLTEIFREKLGLSSLFDPERINLDTFLEKPKEKPSALGLVSQRAVINVQRDIKGELNRFARPVRDVPQPAEGEMSVEFTADRPFMYVVYDHRARVYLFMGRVADPKPDDY